MHYSWCGSTECRLRSRRYTLPCNGTRMHPRQRMVQLLHRSSSCSTGSAYPCFTVRARILKCWTVFYQTSVDMCGGDLCLCDTIHLIAEPSKQFFGRTWSSEPSALSIASSLATPSAAMPNKSGPGPSNANDALMSDLHLYYRSSVIDESCYGVLELTLEVAC